MPCDQFLFGQIRRFTEVEFDTFDPAREAKGKSLTVARIDRRHRVLTHVQALPSKPARNLLLDSASTNKLVAVEKTDDRGSTRRILHDALELHAQHHPSARER